MLKQTLSTKEVASLLNVTETTIKRWADEEKIPCMKTPGKHRKFLFRNVVKFAEAHRYTLTGTFDPPTGGKESEALQFAVQTRNFTRIADLLYAYTLKGNREIVAGYLLYVARNDISLATIIDEIVRPVMVRVGHEWEEGALEVTREHLATNTMTEAFGAIQHELHKKDRNGLTVICACPEFELHELGLRTIACMLDCEGWEVLYLGANTPLNLLQGYIGQMKSDLVLLSLTDPVEDEEAVTRIRILGKHIHDTGGKMIAGGGAVQRFEPSALGCDGIVSGATETLNLVRDLFHLKPGPKKNQ